MSVAVYAPDGKLVHLERENKSIRAFTKTVCQVEVHMPENVQGAVCKEWVLCKSLPVGEWYRKTVNRGNPSFK